MTDILQQVWFPITAMIFVIAGVGLALSQRSRHSRRTYGRHNPIAPLESRDDDRYG